MRQINQTSYMHNRLRMIVASFLSKDLLIDWRWGEKYFADNLNDFDLAAKMAAGNGRHRPGAMRNPISASSIRSRSRKSSIPRAGSSVGTSRNSPPYRTPTSISGGPGPRESNRRLAVVGRDYHAPVVDHAVQRKRRWPCTVQ